MRVIAFFLLISFCSYSQDFKDEFGVFHYKDIVEVDKSKDDIRKIINKAVAINFKDSNHVVKLDTENNLIVKSNLNTRKGLLDFIMDIEYKEGKYKIEFYQFPIIKTDYNLDSPIVDSTTFTKEFLRKICANKIEQSRESIKKIMTKRLERESYFNTMYKRTKKEVSLVYSHVKLTVSDLASKIKNEVLKKEVSDW
ncbi:MAG: hypothetical protein ABJM36_14665 [Algibacter sp.]|uniref:hypothetical protein n=1 Tax=Algibacter sp. TaxID=1872428 RepID=UPI003299C9C8